VRWFLPKTENFTALFEKSSANIVEAVCLFREVAGDLTSVETGIEKLKDLEHEGDRITHETLDKLNTTFITPFDREDIHTLATRLDDILDATDAAGQRLVVYRITEVPPEFLTLSDLLVESAKEVQTAVLALPNRKKRDEAIASCVEINRLENEADVVLREALGDLFTNAHDAIEVIKLKDLYSFLEDATDRCEDVANVIETIIMKGT
jgi:predicted phosphate transport protein (TIGR00153 family)